MVNVEMDGGIKIYLAEIGKTPLLNREEEAELSQKIQKMRLCLFQETIKDIVSKQDPQKLTLDFDEFEILREYFAPKKDTSSESIEDDEYEEVIIENSLDMALSDSITKVLREMRQKYTQSEKDNGIIFINPELPRHLRKFWKTYQKVDIKEPKLVIESGRFARAHMIKANLRLVVKIAQDYANYGLPLLDLISEGNIGLMKAVERFDPNKGGKLSTYAAWWIKQAIKRALANQSKTIRLPVHMIDKIGQMNRVANSLGTELGREPTDEELGDAMNITRQKLSQMRAYNLRPVSLDAPINDEDTTTFGEIVGDESQDDPGEVLELADGLKISQELLDVLDSREYRIIEARFGLSGQKPLTLEEVWQEFGITRERIRQLENIALKKLRRALEKKENPGPRPLGKRREDDNGFFRDNNQPRDEELVGEWDDETQIHRSPLLTPELLSKAQLQLKSVTPRTRKKKPQTPPAQKSKNPAHQEKPEEKPEKKYNQMPLTPEERERLGSLLLHVSTEEGRILCDKDTRRNILDLYLGRGVPQKTIEQVARATNQTVADVRTTLTGMASIFLK
jgi:RNA polymerase primary sigma factor